MIFTACLPSPPVQIHLERKYTNSCKRTYGRTYVTYKKYSIRKCVWFASIEQARSQPKKNNPNRQFLDTTAIFVYHLKIYNEKGEIRIVSGVRYNK